MTAPDQTNADVSDERLRDIKSWAAKLSTWSRADGHPSPEFYGELASVLNELINRRSVTSQASEGEVTVDDVLDKRREQIDALRLGHRRKMSDAGARAEMFSGTGNMSEASIASTESERHRAAFVALNVALEIFDGLYSASPVSKRVERLETANRALAEIKESFRLAGLGTIGAHWQTLIDTIDQALGGRS